MVVRVRDTEILHEVLDRWKAGIDAGAPQRVAEVFTENAIFQGLHPYSVGRRGVVEYYSAQPPGMTVTYRVLETRRPADDLVLGYAKADFAFPDRPAVTSTSVCSSNAVTMAGVSATTRCRDSAAASSAPG